MADLPRLECVGIVGSGLIGTSIGLALVSRGVHVLLRDTDDQQVKLAEAMGAGRRWEGEQVQHAIVATPVEAVAGEVSALQHARLAETTSDAASVKAPLVTEAVQVGCDLTSWCPAHPIAGRERHGAASARADLFAERVWAICPSSATKALAVRTTVAIALACGSIPVQTTPEKHDSAMAVLSHVPQLVASILAGDATDVDAHALTFVGQGFRDTTRLADSDADLWSSIIECNRRPIAGHLRSLGRQFAGLAEVLEDRSGDDVVTAVRMLMTRGRKGRELLPHKVGASARPWSWVGVVLQDRPGQLAALFTAIGGWQVNIEDIGPFEHSLDAPAGIVEVAVDPSVADDLVARLAERGWTAYRRS
jgi:prephenate dehydrogenase